MNPLYHQLRIAALAKQIGPLDEEIVNEERSALDLVGTEAECVAKQARLTEKRSQLDRLLREYFISSEFLRKGVATSGPRCSSASTSPQLVVVRGGACS